MKTKEETKAYNAAYRAAHLEESKAYRAANREKARAATKAYRAANLEKAKAATKAYIANNPEKVRAYQAAYSAANAEEKKAYKAANAEKIDARRRMKKYGVSRDCFQLMLAVQKNACGICDEVFSKTPQVDHDHTTGEVRGLLCGRCNIALGGFKDSLEILGRAKEYLQG